MWYTGYTHIAPGIMFLMVYVHKASPNLLGVICALKCWLDVVYGVYAFWTGYYVFCHIQYKLVTNNY